MLVLKKRSINIVSSFKKYLEDLSKISYTYCGGYPYSDYYDGWDEWDDYYGDGYYGDFFNGGYSQSHQKKKSTIDSLKRGSKRGKRGNKKKGKSIPLYSDSFSSRSNLYDSDEVTIYYYRDINNPDIKEIFYSLYEFNEFLDSEGIYVSKYETKQLLSRSISHCCIDPSFIDLKGEPWLISDSSFGGLSWSVCGDNDSLLDQDSVLCGSNNADDLPF